MNDSNRNDRNGSGVVGDDRDHRQQFTSLDIDLTLIGQRVGEHDLVVGQSELNSIDGIVLVRGRGHVERVLLLGPVVPATG